MARVGEVEEYYEVTDEPFNSIANAVKEKSTDLLLVGQA